MKYLDKLLEKNSLSKRINVHKIRQNLYRFDIEYGWGANVCVSVGDDGILLIDSGYNHTINQLEEQLKLLTDKPVKLIINTHPHNDHIGGNNLLAKDGILISNINATAKFGKFQHLVLVEKEHETLFNKHHIRIISLPNGHSDSDLLIYFTEAKVACMGDIYLSESFPIIGTSLEINAYNLIDNLKKALKILPPDIIIIPGHGHQTTHAELADYIKMVETTMDVVVHFIEKGMPLKQMMKDDILAKWNIWNEKIWFISKESWIRDIYYSYYKRKRETSQNKK